MLCFVFLSLNGETLLSSLQGGQMPLQPWGSLQISLALADVWLPSKPGKSHWSHALPRSLQMLSSSPGQHVVLGGDRQWCPCSSQAASLCLPVLPWQAGLAGAVGGGRQLPHLRQGRRQQATTSQARTERGHQPGTALLTCEKQGVFPAPDMPLQHHQS